MTVDSDDDGNLPARRDATAQTTLSAGWTLPPIERVKRLDPADLILQLMGQAQERAAYFADIIRIKVENEGLEALQIDKTSGNGGYLGQDISALVKLEKDERKFAGDLAIKAIAAGLATRQVELAERETSIVITAMSQFVKAMGLDPSDPSVRQKIVHALTTARDSARVIDGEVSK